jgi:hypothetical protein
MAMLALVPAGQGIKAASGADVVFEWNQVIQATVPAPAGVMTPRYYALAHIAMFDAINAIQGGFEPFRVPFRGGGSPGAAAAQAAHDVLVALHPAAAATYDAKLAEHLGPQPSGFVLQGARLGAKVADRILKWRRNDGWVVSPFPPYSQPLLPGLWQPTPPNNPVAAFTHLQNAVPLALATSTQYLPPPPPTLTSERYAADFNEVRLVGKSDSAVRTVDQTTVARLWAGIAASGVGTATGFTGIWNNVVRDAARARGLPLLETARLFALVNVSVHDALQTTMASKYVYGLWRPVTAIRAADTDLNAATDPDPNWLPFLTTPPYPSYAGNMATIGASAARALELGLWTKRMALTAVWQQSGGLPDVSRQYRGFAELAEEQANSRIYGGIHYRFDSEAGQQIGRKTAEWVFARFMTPRNAALD